MFLTRSTGRKFVVTSSPLSRSPRSTRSRSWTRDYAARQVEQQELTAAPAPGVRLRFTATATAGGPRPPRGSTSAHGIAAADPDLLPVGSVVQIEKLPERYNGIYTVMDTGPKVQGRQSTSTCGAATRRSQLGRRQMLITVLRLGWNPTASTPGWSIACSGSARPSAAAARPVPAGREAAVDAAASDGTARQ